VEPRRIIVSYKKNNSKQLPFYRQIWIKCSVIKVSATGGGYFTEFNSQFSIHCAGLKKNQNKKQSEALAFGIDEGTAQAYTN